MVDRHAPDANTQYRAGSITKTFVAVAVLRLRDAGRLGLSDPIGNYLDADAVRSFIYARTPYDPAAPIPGGVDAAGWQAGPASQDAC